MVPYYGDFAEDDTVLIPFNTFDSNDPSASVTITNLADTDIHVHKDGGLTQSTAGATVVIDYDGITGNHMITVDTSADAFYATGSEYSVRLEGTTVDAATINAFVGAFSIERAGGALALIKAGNLSANVVQISGDGTAADNAEAFFDGTGYAGTNNVIPTTTTVTNQVTANTTAISGDSTAADNLELQYDGTGLAGDTFPSTQSQLDGIANVGSAVHRPADSYTLTTGTQSANTVSSTEALDGTRHEHTDTAGVLSLEYHFLIGGGTPSSIQITGYVTGPNDDVDVFGYDWVSASYKQIGNIQGLSSTANRVFSFDLFVDMVGSGANEGKVDIKLEKASGLTSALLAVDQIFVAFSQGQEGYEGGSVWVDTNASNTNTVVNVDGTARNPVSTIAAATTLLTNTNLGSLQVAPGSSITLAATYNQKLFQGHGWDLALGGQDIDECHIFDCAVSGIGTAATEMEFHDCEIATGSFQKAHFYDCTFSGTASLTLAGDYHIINCQSGVAGSGSPTFAFSAVAITAEFRRWSGGITFSGLTSDDTITVGGEMGTIDLGSPASAVTVEVRGTYKAITNIGSASVNTDGAILAADVAAILVDTGTTIPATLGSPVGADLSADIADTPNTVWDEAKSGHTASGSFGEEIQAHLLSAEIFTDTNTLPGQEAPALAPTLDEAILWLYKVLRNRTSQTATTWSLYADDESTVDAKATVSDDATTAIKQEIVSGP